ncbi:hypothetical protein [Acinetobacter portensis]|uniref:hypothetical protein n=1 Tax=Acinetobacter portensis TaxID=1839785 RepID=UPI0013D65125|nr:hypothetical protein [Acinetobacter portensis]
MGTINWDVFGSFASATATFTGAGVALYIANLWRKQKGSEVSSDISTKIYFKLDTIILKIEKLDASIYVFMDDFCQKNQLNISDFRIGFIDIMDDSNYIKSLINIIITYKNNTLLKQKMDDYDKNVSDLFEFIDSLDLLFEDWDISDVVLRENFLKELHEIIKDLNTSITSIKESLLPYIYHKY